MKTAMTRRSALAAIAFAALLSVISGPRDAHGAAQMLALVANEDTVKIQCYRGDCFAEFTAFCLQPERSSPAEGTRYFLADTANVTVTAQTDDGREISLDPAKDLDYTADRTHVAVRIGMPARRMARLGLRQITIRVGKNVTLVPQPYANDPDPIGEGEVELVSRSLRLLGTRIVDQGGGNVFVARMINRMINVLPPSGRIDDTARAGLWRRTMRGDELAGAPGEAANVVQGIFSKCERDAYLLNWPNMRNCLESNHDRFIGKLNTKYWKAMKTGS
jgi:hypothetical protein